MVFLAGENGGISHTPRDYSNPTACGNCTDLMADAGRTLAEQPHARTTEPQRIITAEPSGSRKGHLTAPTGAELTAG